MISGIYYIINVITDQHYIGSSIDISRRIRTHKRLLRGNKHYNRKLQNSWNKYGETSFVFVKVDECEPNDILKVEQHHIDEIAPYFNLSKSTTAPMMGRRHSKKTKRKMSEIHSNNKYNLGKSWTEEQREKILKKRTGSKRSKKTRKKMSETAKRINSASRFDREKAKKKIKDSNGNVFDSLVDAAKFHKKAVTTICDVLKGGTIATKENVQFKYLDDDTNFDEIKDYRHVHGSHSPHTHLTDQDILDIRASYPEISGDKLAKKYKVNKTTIYNIINKKTWKHI